MPKYFFNIRDGQHYEKDEVGEELLDASTLRDEAIIIAMDLMANADLTGDDYASTQVIEITDEVGKILLKVAVGEAVSADQTHLK